MALGEAVWEAVYLVEFFLFHSISLLLFAFKKTGILHICGYDPSRHSFLMYWYVWEIMWDVQN